MASDIKREQSIAYLEEARLTLESAGAIFIKSSNEKTLWAQVVKNCYDAMEQAISAAIAFKGEVIPKDHPAKITKFIELYGRKDEIVQLLLNWLGKRARAQYIDIIKGEISVPHKLFTKKDAELALIDAKKIIEKIRGLIR